MKQRQHVIHNRRSQSIAEYSALVAVIIAALLIMNIYVKRAYQGRLKHEADTIGTQYAPGHMASKIVTNTTSSSITYTGGQTDIADNPAGGDALITTGGADIEEGTSVTVSKTKSTTKTAEKVDSLGSEFYKK